MNPGKEEQLSPFELYNKDSHSVLQANIDIIKTLGAQGIYSF